MRAWAKAAVLVASTLAGVTAAAGAETTIRIGMVRTISAGSMLVAIDKGYFKELGINVVVEELDSSANALALLSQNRLQAVLGGLSAGYFNALEKGLPITIGLSRVSTPIAHYLMLRSDLKDQVKEIKQLKGRTIATNGPGSVSTYEIGKILETAGLTLADVDIKVIPFAQYAIAFTNKAIDAALAIAPWTWQLPKQGIALPFGDSDALIRPTPVSISVAMINTDWAKAKPESAARFLPRLPARRARLLPGLPWRLAAPAHHRSADPLRHRDPARAAQRICLAGARSVRPHQRRQHARHAGLVRPQQVHRRPLSRRAGWSIRATPNMRRRSSARSCSRRRTASSPAAGD